MDFERYAAFLPEHRRAQIATPQSSWLPWRGRRIHIARAGDPDAPVKAILVHGGGGYSGALWPLAGLATGVHGDIGVQVLAPDMPLYGYTDEPDPAAVRYPDWLDLLSDIVATEHDRPIILFGASMGGMMAYEVAHRTGLVDAVLATCLLDTADPAARRAASRFRMLGRPSAGALRAITPVVGRVRVPMRWLADMSAMSNTPALSALCAADPRGGGVRAPIGFLSSWLNHRHTRPERYRGAPVTLVAPAADTWTPPKLSQRFLQRICAPTRMVLLDNCGHYPIEEPGLTRLEEVGRETVRDVAEQAARP
ncbi:alpha/beta hydrolase [Mycobacterium sp. NPDC003323]